MTQFIPYTEGKVYDVATPDILRPFDMALAKAGHPLAIHDGNAVEALCELDALDTFLVLSHHINPIGHNHLVSTIITTAYLAMNLRLAPLAVKDGRALHVGDWIEIKIQQFHDSWVRHQIGVGFHENSSVAANQKVIWRWPTEVNHD